MRNFSYYLSLFLLSATLCIGHFCVFPQRVVGREVISHGAFNLTSLDGDSLTATVTEEIWEKRLRIVSTGGDTICLDGCGAVLDAKVVQGRFLQLRISQASGNLMHSEEFHLYCVFRGRMQAAILSKTKYYYYEPAWECGYERDVSTDDYYLWEWAFTLSEIDDNYSLKIVERQTVTSKCTLEKNAMTVDSQIVHFDKQFGVFCNGIDTISGEFGALQMDFDGPWTHRERVVCPYISVDLGTKRYFVDGSWCIQDENGRFQCGMGRDPYYDYED